GGGGSGGEGEGLEAGHGASPMKAQVGPDAPVLHQSPPPPKRFEARDGKTTDAIQAVPKSPATLRHMDRRGTNH
ncbi:hypothetical protein, partial [Phreatobacter sp.]|uniref:hypothetical protein n=1 Tax=Phreatobacter sp. TaxID=1966341 RepID=UPI0025F5A7B8